MSKYSFKNSQEFTQAIVAHFYADIEKAISNNTYSDLGPYNPERHIVALNAFIQNQNAFFRAWTLLEDEASQVLYIDLIRFHLAGYRHVRLPTNNEGHWKTIARNSEFPAGESQFKYESRLGPPQHCEFEFQGASLKIDGYAGALVWPFLFRQYFFERGDVRIRPERGDYLVDGGTCMGETSIAFAHAVGSDGWVYGFDPLPQHAEICRYNFIQNKQLAHFKFFEQGLSDQLFEPAQKPAFSTIVKPDFSLRQEGESVPLTTLDQLVENGEIKRVDFLKLDIEGSEPQALRGAACTLRQFKPKLAISIYHDFNHFHEIISLLKEMDLGYCFYIDHYTIYTAETVLYAKADAEV